MRHTAATVPSVAMISNNCCLKYQKNGLERWEKIKFFNSINRLAVRKFKKDDKK